MNAEERYIAALREFYEEKGRPPSTVDWAKEGRFPSLATLARTFGSWTAAKEAAGLPPMRRGPEPDSQPERFVDETADALRRLDEGETIRRLAGELGIRGSTLQGRIARYCRRRDMPIPHYRWGRRSIAELEAEQMNDPTRKGPLV